MRALVYTAPGKVELEQMNFRIGDYVDHVVLLMSGMAAHFTFSWAAA